MSDETTDPIAAIVREAMDYAADHGRITTPEDYADRIRETLATPAAGEEDAWLVTASRPAVAGPGLVAHDWLFRHASECARHVEWLRRPLSSWRDVRILPLYRALRSEAPGEMEIDEAALEEARAVLEDVRDALEVLPPGILGEASEVVEASDGEVGVRSWMIRDELIDRVNRALRSEWKIDEPAREIVRREMPDTRATVHEVADAARRGEGGE